MRTPSAAGPKVGQTGFRCCLTTTELHRLDLAVFPLTRIVESPGGVYLVGSANERPDFRDVDVRMILSDDQFDRLFGHSSALWEAFCYGWARVLTEDSGLRIDFQVQRMTEANENYVAGTRNPLTGRRRRFAAYGDATRFVEAESA